MSHSFVPYLICLVLYGSVRVSTVNELEGEVQVAYYAGAVTRLTLSILVPFCCFIIIIMVIMYSYCKMTDGSFSSSLLGLIMMTMMIMTMMTV